ncbi:glycoside hydrolase family 32 protein [bacterium RCC_150]
MTLTPDVPTLDHYRPRLHYTPARNWMNDPNGLVYHQGLYHLFYQHNPFGSTWGNMSWGHATSADLLAWTEQPVAIPCDNEEAIFSGSVVVDTHNSSGLGDGTTPAMVAIYTSAFTEESARPGIQAQSLAYSLDEGRTWTKYPGNPVLDRGSANFRDPKVFWHGDAAGGYWVMAAVEAKEQRVLLYRSADLIAWDFLSDFTLEDAGPGEWECPDLFELPIDGDPENTAWVLILSTNPGGIAGGSGTRYFIGNFDGVRFAEEPSTQHKDSRWLDGPWLDWGRDYYAAVSFSGLPHRRIMMGWMSNWEYAATTPTGDWRSAMALPREVTLRSVNGRTRLVQAPIAPRVTETANAADAPGAAPASDNTLIATVQRSNACRVRLSGPAPKRGTLGLNFRTDDGDSATIVLDLTAGELRFDRTRSGLVDFHTTFPSIEHAPLDLTNERITLEVYIDACSLEVFAQGGLTTLTNLVFPRGEDLEISFFSDTKVDLEELEVALLAESRQP